MKHLFFLLLLSFQFFFFSCNKNELIVDTDPDSDLPTVPADYDGIFPTPYFSCASTTRYTFTNRPVFITPVLKDFKNPILEWKLNGKIVQSNSLTYKFCPSSPGEYSIQLNITDTESDDAETVSSVMKVICVEASEGSRMREPSSFSSPFSDKVFEWLPAPGQFIGDALSGGMNGSFDSFQSANSWAEARLQSRNFVSLGGFGGYIIVGFDHSIPASGREFDFSIMGNAYSSPAGASNEPGIVWVMQDVNGNGLPDDEWFELKGSESDDPETIRNYSVTYFRPDSPCQSVLWTDSEGASGCIDYLSSFHKQDSYFPAWIKSDSYTLSGTRISPKNHQDPDSGFWINLPYSWGYADNMGSDAFADSQSSGGSGQCNGFKISNAVFPDGSPANLLYVDFVKVQVAVNAKNGWLGEVSTEVLGFRDLSIE